MTTRQPGAGLGPITAEAFEELFDACSNWGRWGTDDQRGALNLITPERTRAAMAAVRTGHTISCSLPLATEPGPENPNPVTHLMTRIGRARHDTAVDPVDRGAMSGDYVAMNCHGFANTHVDAFCHMSHRGLLYNGIPVSRVTTRGALAGSIAAARDGIVGRGILLDLPLALGLDWLEPGTAVGVDDLEATLDHHQVRLAEGDILLVRTGRHARTRAGVPLPAALPGTDTRPFAGLHASTGPWLRERGIAVLGCDGISEVVPTPVPGLFPIHLLTLVSMGIHLVDNADFEALAAACADRRQHDFLVCIAPFRLERGTGSPVNPIAIL